jgi:hypothetical protein
VLRQNGIQPTGAVIAPDGTVTLLTQEGGNSVVGNDIAFDAWFKQHGQ